MIQVYGTPICKDCLAMKIIFEQLHVEYQFTNITDNTTNLRTFLQMRDEYPIFQYYKDNAGIGIPFFMKDDQQTFDINEALAWEGIAPVSEEEINRTKEECVIICKKI